MPAFKDSLCHLRLDLVVDKGSLSSSSCLFCLPLPEMIMCIYQKANLCHVGNPKPFKIYFQVLVRGGERKKPQERMSRKHNTS